MRSALLLALTSFGSVCEDAMRDMAAARAKIDDVPEGCPIPKATHDQLFQSFTAMVSGAHALTQAVLAEPPPAAPAVVADGAASAPEPFGAPELRSAAGEVALVSADAPTAPQRPASVPEATAAPKTTKPAARGRRAPAQPA